MEETTYKYSKYNIELESDTEGNEDEVTIFNTYTSKYITLEKEVVEDLKCETDISLGDFPDYLVDLGIFVPSTLDETKRVLDEGCAYAYKTDVLSYTIGITKRCNYRCSYCFERAYLCNEDMSQKTIDDTIEFIINECNKREDLRLLSIEFFGGEPTLCKEQIYHISEKLSNYCKSKGIQFNTTVVTNGLLFTKEFVDKMVANFGLKKVQITLDGLNPTYAKMKGTSLDSFDKVIENIRYAQNKLLVLIRLNAAPYNVDDLKRLITYLYESNLNIQIYFQNIKDLTKDSESVKENFDDFAKLSDDLYEFIDENNYNSLFKLSAVNPRKCVFCSANVDGYYAIDTKGYLYKCLDNLFNPDYIVGSIYDDITNEELVNKFVPHTLKPQCYECKYLPDCMGKCSVEILKHPTAIDCNKYGNMIKQQIQKYLLTLSVG